MGFWLTIHLSQNFNDWRFYLNPNPKKRGFMKLTKALSVALALSVASIGVSYADNDYDDRLELTAQQDQAYNQNLAKARTIITQKGYQITDELEVDEKRGKLYVTTEAIKGGKKYDIRLDYPSLSNFKATPDRDWFILSLKK